MPNETVNRRIEAAVLSFKKALESEEKQLKNQAQELDRRITEYTKLCDYAKSCGEDVERRLKIKSEAIDKTNAELIALRDKISNEYATQVKETTLQKEMSLKIAAELDNARSNRLKTENAKKIAEGKLKILNDKIISAEKKEADLDAKTIETNELLARLNKKEKELAERWDKVMRNEKTLNDYQVELNLRAEELKRISRGRQSQ